MGPFRSSTRKVTALLLGITCILNTWYIWTHLSARTQDTQNIFSYRGHDHPEELPIPLPEIPPAVLTVEESTHYPVLGAASDKEWFSITSTSYGYVRLGPEGRLFDTSMSHELHCLRVLNLAFGKTRVPDAGHIQHCLNYIRQSILCNPDLTLEKGNFEDRDFSTEKFGATHVCRDWSVWYNVMDENNAKWSNDTV